MNQEGQKEKPTSQNLLSEDAICNSDPILGVILQRSGETRKGAFKFLVVLPVALFVYFMLITLWEDRFWLQSLASDTGYLGMSFLGDSMVWPYFFFIPLLLYLLRRAICKTVALLNGDSNIINDGPESQEKYRKVLDTAKKQLSYNGKWKLGYRVAIAVGLIFWLYNTATCYNPAIFVPYTQAFADKTNFQLLANNTTIFQAYATDTPICIPHNVTLEIDEFPGRKHVFESLNTHNTFHLSLSENLEVNTQQYQLAWTGAMQWRDYQALESFSQEPQWQAGVRKLYQQKRGHKVRLDEPIIVPKWDTELSDAPVSWFSARVWVLVLGYTLLPLILLRVYNLLFVIRSFYKQLSDQSLLKVNLLSVDERRNLHAVSTVVLKINYTLAVILVLLILSFMKEGMEADWHNYLLFIPSIPMLMFLFLWPLIAIRDVVQYDKNEEVERRAQNLDDIYKEVDKIVGNARASSEETKRLLILKESIALQEKLYEKVSSLTVWPIPKNTVMKFAASILLPVVIAIGNKLLAGLLGFIFV